jgi:putative ABC transport system substrate-binding protein
VRRRRFLAGLALAATASRASAQHPATSPVVGYLSGRSRDADAPLVAAFRQGLAEAGYPDERAVAIDYLSAEGHAERLPALAAELIRRRVSVIFASSSNAAVAAKAATAAVPIVFTGASDPVKLGLAASLNRPGGNLTGITMYAHTFSAKRLELLHELVPVARVVGMLVNPTNPSAAAELQDLQAAASSLGLEPIVVEARSQGDIEGALETLANRRARALYLVDDPLFTSRRKELAALAASRSLGMISTLRELADAGALASYGTSFAEIHRQCGLYVGRVLHGESPGDLPIMLPTRFALVINLKTASALGLNIAPGLLATSDEVIE